MLDLRNARRTAAVALAAGALLLALPTAAPAATGEPASFTVNTQFANGPSPVVDATGAFAGCTQVFSSDGTTTVLSSTKLLFSGLKTVKCPQGGQLTLHYDATINTSAGRKTFGSWYVVSSTLPGVTGGSGTVAGDGRFCEVLPGSRGCILDVFSGTLT